VAFPCGPAFHNTKRGGIREQVRAKTWQREGKKNKKMKKKSKEAYLRDREFVR
jgi:hypothetical protein